MRHVARQWRVWGLLGGLAMGALPAEALTEGGVAAGVGGLQQFRHPGFEVSASVTDHGSGQGVVALPGVAEFQQAHRGRWQTAWDDRGNRPNLIQGEGIPLLPGRGNRLQPADAGLAPGEAVTMPVVERLARQFITRRASLFQIGQGDLRLHPASTQGGPNGRLWLLEFEVLHQGIPVEGARVFVRISNGNIVQFGAELVGDIQIDVRPQVSGPAAVTGALARAGVDPATVEVREAGTLKIYPELPAGEVPGERFRGAPGTGYTHRLVREVDFRRAGDPRTYRAVVDAQTGGLLELYDLNRYSTVTGGVYPNTNTDAEVIVPLQNLTVFNRRPKITDAAGIYDYSGGFARALLRGPLVRTFDTCGGSWLTDFDDGNFAFGAGAGTDCTRPPGSNMWGNTHASRNAFHHLNRIKEVALGFLPTNTWLSQQLLANTNQNDTCNAFWDGLDVNFFKSGGGCSNTGEIAAVILHEFGHGLDQNTGGAADAGSGEAVGDTTAFLETQQSCIGPNFEPGIPCHNCGSTGCTGVRDLTPFAQGGAAPIARPSTIEDANGIDCGGLTCGFLQLCRGPMGYECHCESYIASTAVWDLTQLLVGTLGTDGGYGAMKQIWYDSLVPSKRAYRVASGGMCNPAAQVDGCGGSNWYTVFLAVDDDDGNLANGTPNACRIWQAFNAHGIACGAQPPCTP